MGGGNCLFGVTDKTTPIFRGNVSIVEVASADTNPTRLPDVEPLQSGKIDTSTTRCFDLFCVGKYEQGGDLKLNIQSADKIPNLVTKNANGDPVFCEPTPMCTIRAPKGHNVWVKIDLQTITTNASKYMCLGIRKRSEDEYVDVLYTGNLSRYVDVLETDVVELVPLVSSTELPAYTAVKAGETAKITNVNTCDFGSVYRVNISMHNGQWISVQHDLEKFGGIWENNGHLGVGVINGKNQLLAIHRSTTQLASSADGIHWADAGKVSEDSDGWAAGPTYGNGIWGCVFCYAGMQYYSIDITKTWRVSRANIPEGTSSFAFGDGKFIAVSDGGKVYVSADADKWNQVAAIYMPSPRIIGYGNGRWIIGDKFNRAIYTSEDGVKWTSIDSSNLSSKCVDAHGGCYANGYFYAVGYQDGYVVKSSDGVFWERVFKVSSSNDHTCLNVTYFGNKLYVFDGATCYIGLFRPDGTVGEL